MLQLLRRYIVASLQVMRKVSTYGTEGLAVQTEKALRLGAVYNGMK